MYDFLLALRTEAPLQLPLSVQGYACQFRVNHDTAAIRKR